MTKHEEKITESLITFYSDSLRDYSEIVLPRYLNRIEKLEHIIKELEEKLNAK